MPAIRCLALAGLVPLVALAQDIDPTSDPDVQPYPGTPVGGYQLAWSDEFNGDVVNTNKWDFRTGVRYWSVQQPQNNSVSNGLYLLHVKKEPVGTNQYTAGGLISKSLHRYGYYETRMRVPPGRGWHTSFWMMDSNSTTNEPVSIELDALENDTVNLFKYSVNIHRHKPLPHVTFGPKTVNTPSLNADFHVIGCEFTPTQVRYFFDGAVVQSVDATQFPHNDMNIWLTSVAAPLGGTTNVDDSMLPNVAEYEYARFFVLGPTSSVSMVSPLNGVTLTDTNLSLRLLALASSSDSNYPAAVAWSTVSGPAPVTFANPMNADTTARFVVPGSYVLECAAVVGRSTNAARVSVAIEAPLTIDLRQGVNDYQHVATFIRGDSVNWNAGARDQFIVGRWGGQPLRPVFSFDLATIDPSAVIEAVTLDFWTDATLGVGEVGDLELRPLNGTPVEGTGDGSSSSNGAGTGATWLSRTGGTKVGDLWIVPGGDFETNLLSSVPGYNATNAGVRKTFASSPDWVARAQSALAAGQPLDLLVLSPATEAGSNNWISRLSSDDSAVIEQRPVLSLTFIGNRAPSVGFSAAALATNAIPLPLVANVSNAEGVAWTHVSGPGAVGFDDPSQPATTVTFAQAGEHLLRLAAWNQWGEVFRELAVTVAPAPPQLGGVRWEGGQCWLELSGSAGVPYVLQASTNLETWADVLATNPPTMPLIWPDPLAADYPARFYRARIVP
jgi:hypothetical protein